MPRTELYRLVYTSRNLLMGSEQERAAQVSDILATSRRNNARVGVTGALLFNAGAFAQVLEGPREGVETTFERIQRDARHSDVSVLQCEAVPARGFTNWSMAFAGHSPRGQALWHDLASRTGFDLDTIEGDALFATLRRIVLEEETLGEVSGPPALSAPQERPPRALDAETLRAALEDAVPGRRPEGEPIGKAKAPRAVEPPATKPESDDEATRRAETLVLRNALREERERVTALRGELDRARTALAVAAEEIAGLRRHRDIWAGRARALADALCAEPTDASAHAAPTGVDPSNVAA